jgi:hypothetical protein
VTVPVWEFTFTGFTSDALGLTGRPVRLTVG